MSDLCLVAGQGRLPRLVADAAPGLHVASLDGFAPHGLAVDETIRLETLGSFLGGLQARGIARVCFAGAIRRPEVDPARIDAATMPLVPRMMAAMGQGDDTALRTVISLFVEAGLSVVAPTEIAPDLLPPEGVLGGHAPSDASRSDADRAAQVLAAIGPADVGQGCVVARGQVLAVEALPGTEWMLATLAAARGDGPLATALPRGGVLVKAPKPGQDRRIDLPTIGPDTVAQAAAAGLDGIVVQAGGVMVLDRAETVAAADAAGLFLWVRP